jgi:hypothetical protein
MYVIPTSIKNIPIIPIKIVSILKTLTPKKTEFKDWASSLVPALGSNIIAMDGHLKVYDPIFGSLS